MIMIKNKAAIAKMIEAGERLVSIFQELSGIVSVGKQLLKLMHG